MQAAIIIANCKSRLCKFSFWHTLAYFSSICEPQEYFRSYKGYVPTTDPIRNRHPHHPTGHFHLPWRGRCRRPRSQIWWFRHSCLQCWSLFCLNQATDTLYSIYPPRFRVVYMSAFHCNFFCGERAFLVRSWELGVTGYGIVPLTPL